MRTDPVDRICTDRAAFRPGVPPLPCGWCACVMSLLPPVAAGYERPLGLRTGPRMGRWPRGCHEASRGRTRSRIRAFTGVRWRGARAHADVTTPFGADRL